MIGVTGATGTIGRALVRRLTGGGQSVRAFTRRPDRQERMEGIEWVGADLSDRAALADAFDGCDRLFLLTGNTEDMVRLQKNAIRAAAETGVERVVKLSALGATDHSKSVIGLWHYTVEDALRESGVEWTILRPHHFMQNLLDPVTFDRDAGVVHSASGDGAIPFIDTRDIAEVAATVLTEHGGQESGHHEGRHHEDGPDGPGPDHTMHAGEIYTLTGPEAISYRQATEVVSRVLGRELEYRAETPDEAWRRRREAGQPVWLAAAQLAIAGYQRAGGATARTTGAVEALTGRAPRTVGQFAGDHVDALTGA